MRSTICVEKMKRYTVSFSDEQGEILERWADKEVRTASNLIQAIVVGVLRGEPPVVPELPSDKPESK